MRKIMLMYHPIKKEIHFLVNMDGEYKEIEYTDCPSLQKYAPDQGEFLLQDQGKNFFDDIVETFLEIENSKIIFKGTKIDYEDFVKMISNYNKDKQKEVLKLGDFIELQDTSIIYKDIKRVYKETVNIFDKELQDENIKKIYEARKKELDEKIKVLDEDNINLCMVGTYSSGKSTFINAIIGKKILPENINSETAKMFKIKNSKDPSIKFVVKKNKDVEGNSSSIVWDEKNKKFTFTGYINDDGIKKEVEKEIDKSKEQHQQLHNILKFLNDLPNSNKDNNKNYIDSIIEVNYPIPLGENINFTFFDTPGTDSNSSEHLDILKNALKNQTNSILIILYSPGKMEGTGNSILYKLLNKSQNDLKEESDITIDLARSIHVINQADRFEPNEITDTINKKIKISLNKKDEIDGEESSEYEYDLSKKRVFYVSSKGAYCAKAGLENILDEYDKNFIKRHSAQITEDNYFKYDNLADSIGETDELKNSAEEALKNCDKINDENEKTYNKLYISSGMYSIEEEIVKYAKKYALAVKAKALYDGMDRIIGAVKGQYKIIEDEASKEKEDIERQIDIMKTKMIADINDVYKDFESYLNKENIETKNSEIEEVRDEIGKLNQREVKEISNKIGIVAFGSQTFNKRNEDICNKLNKHIYELDKKYKGIRVKIFNRQMDSLKKKISDKIQSCNFISSVIKDQILNISDTLIPESKLDSSEIKKYINTTNVLFLKIVDKNKYTEELEKSLQKLTQKKYDEYIGEIESIAKSKGNEMKQRFIDNIENVSETLEKLKRNRQEVSNQLKKAKEVLDIVDKKYSDLNKKVWGDINE